MLIGKALATTLALAAFAAAAHAQATGGADNTSETKPVLMQSDPSATDTRPGSVKKPSQATPPQASADAAPKPHEGDAQDSESASTGHDPAPAAGDNS